MTDLALRAGHVKTQIGVQGGTFLDPARFQMCVRQVIGDMEFELSNVSRILSCIGTQIDRPNGKLIEARRRPEFASMGQILVIMRQVAEAELSPFILRRKAGVNGTGAADRRLMRV